MKFSFIKNVFVELLDDDDESLEELPLLLVESQRWRLDTDKSAFFFAASSTFNFVSSVFDLASPKLNVVSLSKKNV